VHVAEANRAAARNAGIEAATGSVVAFVDDDVWLPPGFVAAHARAHGNGERLAVSGPILNVESYDERPKPSPFNYSNAFLCTCNVSVPREALLSVSGFDARFNLYGWEDTELGLRLRRSGLRRAFAWDAFLYHIKPPKVETLDELARKASERAQMAALLLEKDRGLRTKLATGAYAANLWRARVFSPASAAPLYRRLAESERLAPPLRALARTQYLDAVYVAALRRALAERAH
jgi:glycosyltransferase involved in cell wall biosynthesis